MEGTALISKPTKSKDLILLFVVIGVLVAAVIGLVVALIVVATDNKTETKLDESEKCAYYNEIQILTNETHGLFRENREKLLTLFTYTNDTEVIYLRGNSDVIRNDDVTYVFRQESNFIYLTGTDVQDLHLVIHPASRNSTLFVPRRDTTYAVWNGVVLTIDQIKAKYDFDRVLYYDELAGYLAQIGTSLVYTLGGANFPFSVNYTINGSYLNTVLNIARRVKSEKELKVLTFVNKISSHAHEYVMRKCATKLRNKEPVWEYELESYFLHSTYNCRARLQSYTSIVGAGAHSAILHYVANDAQIFDGDLILIDAGAELWGYGADITRTYPASGKFTEKQKEVYDIVLKAQTASADALREGALWSVLNNITRVTITQELAANGFINGSFADLWNSRIYSYFIPHGMGHSLGLDVHDSDFGSSPIESGAFVTVEPGVYFNEALLQTAQDNPTISHFFVWNKIDAYRGMGGVRIEDDYIVTKTGNEKTTSVTSDAHELEKLLSQNI